MFRVRSCPRCVGDLFLEEGDCVREWVCLQCGHRASTSLMVAPGLLPSGAQLKDRCFDRAADRDLEGYHPGERRAGLRVVSSSHRARVTQVRMPSPPDSQPELPVAV